MHPKERKCIMAHSLGVYIIMVGKSWWLDPRQLGTPHSVRKQ